ncbi:hypothetical protein D0869_02024 [Hortaea werneckii]|uniref:Uncharacterized protein n=1 Tax=Hortaea werneckii TaxID=91943 RepID=A0A3M6ZIU7_HORWE|nr:hypothetical protein D0869_02024 [Hortaea werneckii]RMY15049.1 hypothetical protein D0868_01102 [Hortaea werneckii]
MQQLLTTEWLAKPWLKDEILIPVNQQPNLGTSYVVERPYLVHHFAGASPISILIMLGVYIMELWFGKPIETYQMAAQLTVADALQTWFDRKRDELPIPLETAVSICLDTRQQNDVVAVLLPEIVTVLAKTNEAWSST